jgi:hypothetical protein
MQRPGKVPGAHASSGHSGQVIARPRRSLVVLGLLGLGPYDGLLGLGKSRTRQVRSDRPGESSSPGFARSPRDGPDGWAGWLGRTRPGQAATSQLASRTPEADRQATDRSDRSLGACAIARLGRCSKSSADAGYKKRRGSTG